MTSGAFFEDKKENVAFSFCDFDANRADAALSNSTENGLPFGGSGGAVAILGKGLESCRVSFNDSRKIFFNLLNISS